MRAESSQFWKGTTSSNYRNFVGSKETVVVDVHTKFKLVCSIPEDAGVEFVRKAETAILRIGANILIDRRMRIRGLVVDFLNGSM